VKSEERKMKSEERKMKSEESEKIENKNDDKKNLLISNEEREE
jgi:hypothetical protein